jgi:ecotin
MGGTLRASITQQPKEERFITIGGDPFLIRYNSRLPVVVYVPKGVEVKYRVWSAGERTLVMDPG